MFNMNKRYDLPIVASIVAPIQIKHVHSSVSYHWAIHQNYYQCGHELPNGYGALAIRIIVHNGDILKQESTLNSNLLEPILGALTLKFNRATQPFLKFDKRH